MAFKKSIRKTIEGYLEKLNERFGNLSKIILIFFYCYEKYIIFFRKK